MPSTTAARPQRHQQEDDLDRRFERHRLFGGLRTSLAE